MPGTRAFCPMIVNARAGPAALELDVRALIHDLEVELGAELLLRPAVWMTLRESRSSFEIAGEADKTDRIQRFADVLARRTGQGDHAPLDDAALSGLQREILGQRTSVQQFGLRHSPVFVGELVRHQEIVHSIAPAPEDLADMLAGLHLPLRRGTVREDMQEESRYLRSHGQARAPCKEILEMPDAQVDRVIRSIQDNRGELSGALRKELPILAEPGLWEAIVQGVHRALEIGPRSEAADIDLEAGKSVL